MTYKENITAILECYFTGFKDDIIDSACNRILEQGPCEDAISRQAVLDYIYNDLGLGDEENGKDVERQMELDSSYRYVKSLPSVTPQQKPCDDCISRQAVLEYIEGSGAELGHGSENELVCQDIKELPSVTPQPKSGHWIDDNENEIDAQYGRHLYKCSECNEYADMFVGGTEDWWDLEKPNYCPNCGAKMIESQESDHKCHTCKHYTSGENDGSCGSYICKGYSNWESEDKE